MDAAREKKKLYRWLDAKMKTRQERGMAKNFWESFWFALGIYFLVVISLVGWLRCTFFNVKPFTIEL